MSTIDRDPYIRVVAMTEAGAKQFCADYLGIPAGRIGRVESVPIDDPEVRRKAKEGARTFDVYLVPARPVHFTATLSLTWKRPKARPAPEMVNRALVKALEQSLDDDEYDFEVISVYERSP